jgi:hypothetical protein
MAEKLTVVKMYAENSSEMSMPVYHTARRDILEDRYLNIDYRERSQIRIT